MKYKKILFNQWTFFKRSFCEFHKYCTKDFINIFNHKILSLVVLVIVTNLVITWNSNLIFQKTSAFHQLLTKSFLIKDLAKQWPKLPHLPRLKLSKTWNLEFHEVYMAQLSLSLYRFIPPKSRKSTWGINFGIRQCHLSCLQFVVWWRQKYCRC